MNDLSTFTYGAKPVRVIDRDGQPWWVLKDVCDVLDIQNVTQAGQRLDDDEKAMSDIGLKNGVPVNIISESGLYSVILRSDKPEARKFRKWVTSEVLPSIRKTGGYIRDAAARLTIDQLPAIIAAAVKATLEAAGITPGTEPEPIPRGELALPPHSAMKVEKFPPELVRAINAMIDAMEARKRPNYSYIKQYCVTNGYYVSNPTAKKYYVRYVQAKHGREAI
jgi:prophage antirepressor-like protein